VFGVRVGLLRTEIALGSEFRVGLELGSSTRADVSVDDFRGVGMCPGANVPHLSMTPRHISSPHRFIAADLHTARS